MSKAIKEAIYSNLTEYIFGLSELNSDWIDKIKSINLQDYINWIKTNDSMLYNIYCDLANTFGMDVEYYSNMLSIILKYFENENDINNFCVNMNGKIEVPVCNEIYWYDELRAIINYYKYKGENDEEHFKNMLELKRDLTNIVRRPVDSKQLDIQSNTIEKSEPQQTQKQIEKSESKRSQKKKKRTENLQRSQRIKKIPLDDKIYFKEIKEEDKQKIYKKINEELEKIKEESDEEEFSDFEIKEKQLHELSGYEIDVIEQQLRNLIARTGVNTIETCKKIEEIINQNYNKEIPVMYGKCTFKNGIILECKFDSTLVSTRFITNFEPIYANRGNCLVDLIKKGIIVIDEELIIDEKDKNLIEAAKNYDDNNLIKLKQTCMKYGCHDFIMTRSQIEHKMIGIFSKKFLNHFSSKLHNKIKVEMEKENIHIDGYYYALMKSLLDNYDENKLKLFIKINDTICEYMKILAIVYNKMFENNKYKKYIHDFVYVYIQIDCSLNNDDTKNCLENICKRNCIFNTIDIDENGLSEINTLIQIIDLMYNVDHYLEECAVSNNIKIVIEDEKLVLYINENYYKIDTILCETRTVEEKVISQKDYKLFYQLYNIYGTNNFNSIYEFIYIFDVIISIMNDKSDELKENKIIKKPLIHYSNGLCDYVFRNVKLEDEKRNNENIYRVISYIRETSFIGPLTYFGFDDCSTIEEYKDLLCEENNNKLLYTYTDKDGKTTTFKRGFKLYSLYLPYYVNDNDIYDSTSYTNFKGTKKLYKGFIFDTQFNPLNIDVEIGTDKIIKNEDGEFKIDNKKFICYDWLIDSSLLIARYSTDVEQINPKIMVFKPLSLTIDEFIDFADSISK